MSSETFCYCTNDFGVSIWIVEAIGLLNLISVLPSSSPSRIRVFPVRRGCELADTIYILGRGRLVYYCFVTFSLSLRSVSSGRDPAVYAGALNATFDVGVSSPAYMRFVQLHTGIYKNMTTGRLLGAMGRIGSGSNMTYE